MNNDEMTPNKDQQLIWVQEALIQDGFEKMSISSSKLSYYKEVRDNVAIVVNLDDGKHDISFLAFGKRVDDDKDNFLGRIGTLIADAMTGILPTTTTSSEVIGDVVPPVENAESNIQKPAKNINSAGESVKNADSAIEASEDFTVADIIPGGPRNDIPTVHKAPIKMTQFTPTGTMIKGVIPQLKEIGKLKIGKKGMVKKSQSGKDYRPPEKFDHFEVVTLQKDANGDFIPDKPIMDIIGTDAKEINIHLLYNDPTLNFMTWYREYKGGKCLCEGDGEFALDKTTGKKIICDIDSCPKYANKKCKLNGILSVILPDAPRLGGVYKFRTTGFNSVRSILSSMFFLQSLTGGVLANIPLKLTVSPQSVNPIGSTTAQTIYVVNLEYAGTVDDLHRQTVALMTERASMQHKIAELESQARVALGMPESAEEIQDVTAEFYPDTE